MPYTGYPTLEDFLKANDAIEGAILALKGVQLLVPTENGKYIIKALSEVTKYLKEYAIQNEIYILAADAALYANKDPIKGGQYIDILMNYYYDYKHFLEVYAEIMDARTAVSSGSSSGSSNDNNTGGNIGQAILDAIKKGIEELKKHLGSSKSDPLVIDLDKNGFTATTANEGTYFNLDSTGYAEKTAWTSEAFLALDRNGNGVIDDGTELFSDTVVKSDGTLAVDGFDALADLDENGDGIIDSNDSMFFKLLIWQDLNGDGISTPDELKTLTDLGIVSIDISNIRDADVLINDDVNLKKTAVVNFADGSSTVIGEFMFANNGYDTLEEEIEITDSEILSLPNVRQFGNIPSLHNAMAMDETGTVKAFLYEFIQSNDMAYKEQIVEKMLMFLCDAESVSENNDVVDVKHLRVIEYMFGKYDGVFTEHSGSNLEGIYKDIVNIYYNTINIQSCLKDWADASSALTNYGFYEFINAEISNNPSDTYKLGELARYLKFISTDSNYQQLTDYFAYFADVSDEYAKIITDGCNMGQGTVSNDSITGDEYNNIIFGGEGDDALYGNEGNDVLSGGSGNDILHGGDGHDTLLGKSGDDIIYGDDGYDKIDGGAGNDTLYGGAGNDTYIFKRGYGVDTIWDFEGLNFISFGDNISENDITLFRENNNLVISIVGTEDKLIIGDYYASENYKNFALSFEDGTYKSYALTPEYFNNLSGTEESDYMMGISSDVSVTLHGNGGDDTLVGGDKDDILDGGSGNDLLYGGNGNDTYIFGKGYGNDTIDDLCGDSIVDFKDVNADDVTFSIANYSDLEITINETGDKLTILNYAWNQYEYTFKFADGSLGIYDKETSILSLDTVQTNADILSMIYSENKANTGNALDNLLESAESYSVSDLSSIQMLILVENMSAFSVGDNIFDSADILNSSEETSALNQLLVNTQA